MLRVRVMPTLLYKDLGLVKGVGFDSWRRVGSLMQAIKVYNMRDVDELVFLDITATRDSRGPDFQLVDDFADECIMPLTVGGGISTPEDIRALAAVCVAAGRCFGPPRGRAARGARDAYDSPA